MLAGITVSTDPVQDVIAGLLLVTTIIGGLNHRQGKANATKINEVVIPKLVEVHELANANLTDAQDRRDVSEARVTQLIDTAANAAAEATIKRTGG
jgi:hypothetical protein